MESSADNVQWCFIVEAEAGGYGYRILELVQEVNGDREAARQAAEYAAWNYLPTHPRRPQRRRVFRISPDAWSVILEGMARTLHIYIHVAQYCGEAPR